MRTYLPSTRYIVVGAIWVTTVSFGNWSDPSKLLRGNRLLLV